MCCLPFDFDAFLSIIAFSMCLIYKKDRVAATYTLAEWLSAAHIYAYHVNELIDIK